MTLRLTDDEARALRDQAETEQRSVQDVAREAVREYIARRAHKSRVRASSEFGATYYAEALGRLGTL